ncbi:MAG: DeoR/GlpR family DNA-binding transcription regulator [Acidobacteriota bacterium]
MRKRTLQNVKEENLLREERQMHILRMLEREGRVVVTGLCRVLNVSEDTIRRDLRALEERGLARKVHGGALHRLASVVPYEVRKVQDFDVKDRIGRRAAEMVNEGDSVIIDHGSTTLSMAKALTVSRLRVVTNSFEIARAVAEKPHYELIILGGRWDNTHQEIVGPMAVQQISQYHLDKVFIGMTALSRREGITDLSEADAVLKRAMIEAGETVIGLADSSKVGKVAFCRVGDLDSLDVLVTDDQADEAEFNGLSLQIVRVSHAADCSPTSIHSP